MDRSGQASGKTATAEIFQNTQLEFRVNVQGNVLLETEAEVISKHWRQTFSTVRAEKTGVEKSKNVLYMQFNSITKLLHWTTVEAEENVCQAKYDYLTDLNAPSRRLHGTKIQNPCRKAWKAEALWFFQTNTSVSSTEFQWVWGKTSLLTKWWCQQR